MVHAAFKNPMFHRNYVTAAAFCQEYLLSEQPADYSSPVMETQLVGTRCFCLGITRCTNILWMLFLKKAIWLEQINMLYDIIVFCSLEFFAILCSGQSAKRLSFGSCTTCNRRWNGEDRVLNKLYKDLSIVLSGWWFSTWYMSYMFCLLLTLY